MYKFKVGDKVQVKNSIDLPVCSWGHVKHGDIGVVTSIKTADQYADLTIDFPNHPYWFGLSSETQLINPNELY